MAEDLGIVGNSVRMCATGGDINATKEGGAVHGGGDLANAPAVFWDGAFLFDYEFFAVAGGGINSAEVGVKGEFFARLDE